MVCRVIWKNVLVCKKYTLTYQGMMIGNQVRNLLSNDSEKKTFFILIFTFSCKFVVISKFIRGKEKL